MNYRAILVATAQTLGLFVSGFAIPLLGQILALFTPVPLILVSVRNSGKEGFATLFASCLVMTALGGWQAAAVLFLGFGLMALGVAEGLRRKLRPEQISLLGGLLPIAVLTAIAAVFIVQFGKNPFTEADAYLRESLAAAAKTYAGMGLTEMAAMASSIPDITVYYLARLIPGILVATSLLQAACCFGIARSLLLRNPGAPPEPDQTPLSSWHAPDSWVWGLIATLALLVLPRETARFAGWNLAILFAALYLAQGVAIVDHYLRKAGLKKPFFRGLLLALILAMPSIVFVIALGIVDIWADFRKVRAPAQTA